VIIHGSHQVDAHAPNINAETSTKAIHGAAGENARVAPPVGGIRSVSQLYTIKENQPDLIEDA
jgi:hypothetical protein